MQAHPLFLKRREQIQNRNSAFLEYFGPRLIGPRQRGNSSRVVFEENIYFLSLLFTKPVPKDLSRFLYEEKLIRKEFENISF